MQAPNHRERQWPLAVEHRGHPGAVADIGFEVLAGQSKLFHLEVDRIDGVRRQDGVVLGLIGFDQ